MSENPVPRINSKHGFMKSIIQNQFDRDNYDKEVRSKQNEKRTSSKKQRKKPEAGVYIPPVKLSTRPEGKEILFNLEFEDREGTVYTKQVYTCDKAINVARRISAEHHLPPSITSALEQRLQEEFRYRIKQDLPI